MLKIGDKVWLYGEPCRIVNIQYQVEFPNGQRVWRYNVDNIYYRVKEDFNDIKRGEVLALIAEEGYSYKFISMIGIHLILCEEDVLKYLMPVSWEEE